jgi:UDP-N-acetyl-D-glucosamine dehydrogenase
VGLPLAVEMARSGYRTLGFDVSEPWSTGSTRGRATSRTSTSRGARAFVGEGLLSATTDMSRLAECDAISICVPTPLNKIKDPDLSYVVAATQAVAARAAAGQLDHPGEHHLSGHHARGGAAGSWRRAGLVVGEDFFLCFSPERVDPGNAVWHTRNTPKVLGGVTERAPRRGWRSTSASSTRMVPVESAEAAELVKVYENTFRMINIALANELAQACDKLGWTSGR